MGTRVEPHNIKENHRRLDIRQVIYLDIETYQDKVDSNTLLLPFRLAVAHSVKYDKDLNPHHVTTHTCREAHTLAHFISNIANRNGRTYLVAHNAPFDIAASYLLHYLQELGFTINILRPDSGSMVITAKRKKQSLVLLDTLNFLDGSIESLGKIVGIEKLEVDFQTVDDEALETYCKRDVEIMRTAFEQYLHFLKENDLGNFGLTISAQAFNAFRHRFMRHRIHIHNNLEAKRLERLAYGGGLTMPFAVGDFRGTKIYKTDVNSMYPKIMRDSPMPTRFIGFAPHPSIEQLKEAIKYYAVIADVTLRPKTPFYRRRTQEGTIYPTYAFRTALCTPEVKEALKEDAILEVYQVALYKQDIIFDQYVKELYTLRKQYKIQGNVIYEKAVKKLLNSLYGKFGTRTRKWTERPDLTAIQKIQRVDSLLTPTGLTAVYYLNGKAYTFEDNGDAENTFVAIAAHITAYARMYLKELIETAGVANVYYCDTDSLFVNETGIANLKDYLDDNELGKLKIEEVSDDLMIYGKKDYHFNKIAHIKGISKTAQQIDDNTYIVQYWQSLLGSLNSPTPKPYQITMVKKQLKRNITFASVNHNRLLPLNSPPPYDPTPLEHTPLPYKEFAPN